MRLNQSKRAITTIGKAALRPVTSVCSAPLDPVLLVVLVVDAALLDDSPPLLTAELPLLLPLLLGDVPVEETAEEVVVAVPLKRIALF